jgi:hypothetical protein
VSAPTRPSLPPRRGAGAPGGSRHRGAGVLDQRAPAELAAIGSGPRAAGLAQALGWLTLPRLWVVVVLGAIGVMQLALTPSAIDLAYHVRAGELMVDTRSVLRTDVFAWPTAGQAWLDQNWGAQVVLYGLWRLGGFPLIVVVNALVTVAAWGLVVLACRERTSSLRVAAGAVLVGYLGSVFIFSARPQMFSVLLFATEVYLLEVARRRPWALAGIPLLMAAWANLHGAFLLGLGLVVIEAVVALYQRQGRVAARLALAGATGAAALLTNPWGVGVLRYSVGLVSNPDVTVRVTEWAAPSARDPAGAGFFAALALVVAVMARTGVPPRAVDQVARIVPLTALSLWTLRAGLWWGLVLPVVLACLTREREPRPAAADQGTPLLTGSILLLLAVSVVAVAPGSRALLFPGANPASRVSAAPAATVDWLAAHPQPGRMFNYQPWGSYLEFRLGPGVKPAVDSRIELTSPAFWRDYYAIVGGRWDAQRLLAEHDITYVVTDARRTPDLVADLVASDRWRLAFSTRDERVYVRR